MLKPVNRLTKKKEFDKVFTNGRSSFNHLIGVKVLKSGLTNSRFGIIVGSKVSKKAVLRNRIKRQIRAAARGEAPGLKPGRDYLIMALPLIVGKKYVTIRESLAGHFHKLRAYKTSHTVR